MPEFLTEPSRLLMLLGFISINVLNTLPAQGQAETSTLAQAQQAARSGVEHMGNHWSREVFNETVELYAHVHRETHSPEMPAPEEIQYGPDPQQSLMLFIPEQPFSEPGPVGIFIHGNGFGDGDQIIPDSDSIFYSHYGKLMTTLGGIGITMNYRTGTDSSPMTGAEDLALAHKWIKSNIARYGGSTDTIVLLASSEGAALTANYLFNPAFQKDSDPRFAMVVLISGEFDDKANELSAQIEQYEGEQIPLLLWSPELDSIESETSSIKLYGMLCKKFQQCPAFEKLPGHNRLSAILSLGTTDTSVFNSLIRFYHTIR